MRNRYMVETSKSGNEGDWKIIRPGDPFVDDPLVQQAAKTLRDETDVHAVMFRKSHLHIRVSAVDSFHLDFPRGA